MPVAKKTTVSMARYTVPVVRNAFRILEELSKAGSLTLNEATVRTGVSKSTVFRVLTTLSELGYVAKDADRNYYITPALGGLVNDVANMEALKKLALAHMLRLRDEFGESVNLGQLVQDKITYVEVVPSEYALRLHEKPGATVPFHCSALGKAILAFSSPETVEGLLSGRELPMLTRNTMTDIGHFHAELKRVREKGYAFDRGEASLLATCIGAPILSHEGIAIAAISISGPTSRFVPRNNSPVVEKLMAAVADVSRQLRMQTARASVAQSRQ